MRDVGAKKPTWMEDQSFYICFSFFFFSCEKAIIYMLTGVYFIKHDTCGVKLVNVEASYNLINLHTNEP